MKIRHTKREEIDINLSNDEVITITKAKLYELVYPGRYLQRKWDPKLKPEDRELWLAHDDPNWRHGSVSTEYVRPATELDKAIFLVIDNL